MPALKPRCSLIPAILSLAVAAAQTTQPSRVLDVPYLPTTEEAVRAMLQLANVKKTDIVYDLGCGDGRIVIAAAKTFGAHGVGIDIDHVRITRSKRERQEGRGRKSCEI